MKTELTAQDIDEIIDNEIQQARRYGANEDYIRALYHARAALLSKIAPNID